MSRPVLEAVPNFSEGRDLDVVADLVRALERPGTEVLDWSADPDHHRSVVTLIGEPAAVEDAVVEAAAVAVRRIDLTTHTGVHPRIGAIDVLPLVPLAGLTMDDAVLAARRVGRRLGAEVGLPVYFYGAAAADREGRGLARLRRGGFETLRQGWPEDRAPDVLPPDWPHPGAHPTAGVTCVGARKLLLAWNVDVEGITLDAARGIARRIREIGGGFTGLRAMALELPRQGRIQISMNLEDVEATSPLDVVQRIEALTRAAGGRAGRTEVIGMMPDELVFPAASERLRLTDAAPERLLSRRLARHLSTNNASEA